MDNTIERIIRELHVKHRSCGEGALADYIPELTKANPDWFGISVFTTDGFQYQAGDCEIPFTIQSVSKAFTYGMILDDYGMEYVEKKVGVEPSGEAFNSISLDPGTGRPRNPMINAGAIATTGQIAGDCLEQRFQRILTKFSSYAGRDLDYDEEVYQSESATGFRNRAIAHLLRNFEIIGDPVEETVEIYFRQCSIQVTCRDLALMGGALANGGVNPVTGERVIKLENVDKVLSVMSTCGMYDYSGTWIYEVGLPAKSGVGGGVVGILPGQLGVAVFSPLLDEKGNSVRGIRTFRDLSKRFNLHLFNFPSLTDHAIRRIYTLSQVSSSRRRSLDQRLYLRKNAGCTRIFEMQGDLFLSSLERLIRATQRFWEETEFFIFDLKRAGLIDYATTEIIIEAATGMMREGKNLLLIDPNSILDRNRFTEADVPVLFSDHLDDALEFCENKLLERHVTGARRDQPLGLAQFSLFRGFSDEELAVIREHLQTVEFRRGQKILNEGDPPDYAYLLASGAVSVCLQREEATRPERLAAFYPGVVFGEIGMIDRKPRSADVWADEPSTCYRLSLESVNTLKEEHSPIYGKLLQHLLLDLSERLRLANQEVALLKG